MTHSIRTFLNDQDGVASAWGLFFTVTLLVIGGMAVDYSNGTAKRAQLQAAADSAALAAVVELPDMDKATEAGLEYADQHFDAGDGAAIDADSFIYGNWSGGAFSAGDTPTNAVYVRAAREGVSGNELATYLLRLIGITSFDVVAGSIAAEDSENSCRSGGFFTEQRVISGSNNDYVNGFCLYGARGVKISSDNTFEPGVGVLMNRIRNLEQGGNNSGIDEALMSYDYTLQLPALVVPMVNSTSSGSLAGLPDYIRFGPVYLEKIEDTTPLSPNTLYVVEDVADLGSNRTFDNIAIVAEKEVKIGSNNTLYNVVFLTMDKVLIGSNNDFGHPTACTNGRYSTYFFSGSNIEFGSNNHLTGIQMAALDEIKLGSDIRGIEDVHGEALGNFDYGSADTYGGCDGEFTSDFGIQPGLPVGGQIYALVQ